MEFELDLAALERALRAQEDQPWLKMPDKARRSAMEAQFVRELHSVVAYVLARPVQERRKQWRLKWPAPSTVELGGTDLLACQWDQAHRALAKVVKNPVLLETSAKRVRRLRGLAETYVLQQELLELCRDDVRSLWEIPVSSLSAMARAAGVVAGPPAGPPVAQALREERDLARVKGELYATWIQLEIERLGLYLALNIDPPPIRTPGHKPP